MKAPAERGLSRELRGSAAGPGPCPGSLSRLLEPLFPQLSPSVHENSARCSSERSEAGIDGSPRPPQPPAPPGPGAARGASPRAGAPRFSWGKERLHSALVLLFDAISAHGVFTAPQPGRARNRGRKGRCGRGAAPPLAVFTPNKARGRGLALTFKTPAGGCGARGDPAGVAELGHAAGGAQPAPLPRGRGRRLPHGRAGPGPGGLGHRAR